MEYANTIWNKSAYKTLLAELNSLAEPGYKAFQERLCTTSKAEILGVRSPYVKKIAKSVAKGDVSGFLSVCENTYYEEVLLKAFVIAFWRCPISGKWATVEAFVPKIDNWAVCDVFCSGIKDTKKHMTEMREFINGYLFSDKEYELRFAAVMLMDYYLCDEYILSTLNAYNNINHDGYYVKMAVAWGISTAFIKQREKTLDFLHNNNLDNFTFNKAIQKMRESYRVSAEDKEMLLKLKRR